jgi:hypothetical protein
VSAKTLIFIILGLIFPLWPISLPLFWYLAYKSSNEDKSQQLEVARASQVVVSPSIPAQPAHKKASLND